MQEAERLSRETVDVWVAPLDVPAALLESLVAGLTAAERARAGRYRYWRDARRFLAARGWLRRVLGATLGTAPPDVALTDGPAKPALAGCSKPCFNLSRSEDLALIAVARLEVGVDVEHVSHGQHALDAASLACTPQEIAILDQLPPSARADTCLGWWTTKEAYLKAAGLGLSFPPDRVEVGTESAGGALPVRIAGAPPRWWAHRLRPASGYLGAVVAEGRTWEVRLRPITELQLSG